MGTETYRFCFFLFVIGTLEIVKLNNPLMGTETTIHIVCFINNVKRMLN